jgi:predicted metal-dependent phosphoesterase TrpH
MVKKMIQDLHSHTYYSFCGKDDPTDVIEAAIAVE